MKTLRWITSLFAWLQIVASPLLVGSVIAFAVYKNYPTKTGLVSGICIVVVSLVTGVIIATRIQKRGGAINYISKTSAFAV